MAVAPLRNLPPPPPVNQDVDSRQFRDWFYTVFQQTNGNLDGLGTMAFENSDNVSVTGGSLSNINLSTIRTPGLTGYLKGNGSSPVTAVSTIPYTDISGLSTVAHTGAYSDLSGLPTLGTMAAQNVGINATITTAKLTALGANGSMTFVNGILTSQTQAT